jgi:hypothetical protein
VWNSENRSVRDDFRRCGLLGTSRAYLLAVFFESNPRYQLCQGYGRVFFSFLFFFLAQVLSLWLLNFCVS